LESLTALQSDHNQKSKLRVRGEDRIRKQKDNATTRTRNLRNLKKRVQERSTTITTQNWRLNLTEVIRMCDHRV
jgi:ribosomal protein S30